MRYKILPFVVSILLLIIPFFWLKPGWIDIGGDSSRLYFYDPINYLKSFPLYVIAPTGTSVLMIGHHFIPFGLLLYVLKLVLFNSSYLLVTLFNGMQLVVAFLSVYFITRELLQHKGTHTNEKPISILASTIAGLFYILSPVLSPNGWDKAMIVHNQLFLNPLIFFLLLRSLHTKKIIYILLAFLVTFFFASNFSPGPPPFAFFPLVLFYLLLYAIFVNKTAINFRKIILIIFLFIALHLFHLIPQGVLLFSTEDNPYRQAAFSQEGKFDRGLGYFIAVASTYKFVNNIVSLPQGISPVPVPKALESFWFIFPIVLVIGFIKNVQRKKPLWNNFLLLGIFFLVTLFLATANVTNLGFALYKSLFNIPGFSMFRNYYGQFSFVFIFFYALLLGYALFYIFETISTKRRMTLFLSLSLFIFLSSWSFIKGDMINLVLNKGFTPEVGITIKMDPIYEQALSYIRQNQIDGKFLSFPFTEGGHQIFAGKEGGAYDGPSTISYLTGKVDFAGRSGLYPFGELFLRLSRNKDYESLKSLLSFLNVKYIFYNSDPYIFGEHFYRIPPYQEMQKYLPINQSTYKSFVDQFDVSKKVDIGDKYHIYEVTDANYLPHIYIAKTLAKFDGLLTDVALPRFLQEDIRMAFIDGNAAVTKDTYPFDGIYLTAKQKSTTLESFKNRLDVQTISSTVPAQLYPAVFPFLALPQKGIFPNEAKRIYDSYFDSSIYAAEDIISTIEKSTDPSEEMFLAYAHLMQKVEDNYKQSQDPFIHSASNEINMKRILIRHENRLTTAIRKSTIDNLDKQKFLESLAKIFESLQSQLTSSFPQVITLTYSSDIPTDGSYDVYVKRDDIKRSMQKKLFLTIDEKQLLPKDVDSQDHWIHFGSDDFKSKEKVSITFSFPYYVDDKELWKRLESRDLIASNTVLLEGNVAKDYVSNVINAISVWEPNALYLVSFEYQITGAWKTYRAILESDENSKSAFLQVLSGKLDQFDSTNPPNIEIRNLSVVKIPVPEIVLRKKETAGEEKIIPKITFTKINPTKYKVQVKGAVGPYVLIFLDAYNNNWKLFPVDRISSEDRKVAEYFQGDIAEGIYKNIFLDTKTFEAWGRKAIAQDRHFLTNGYANGWYILPSDTKGATAYTLVLEMTAQRIFYICFGVSLVAFIICSLWVGMLLLGKQK